MRGSLFEYPIGQVLEGPRQRTLGLPALLPPPSKLFDLQSVSLDGYLKHLALDVDQYMHKIKNVMDLFYQTEVLVYPRQFSYVEQIITFEVTFRTSAAPVPPNVAAASQPVTTPQLPPPPRPETPPPRPLPRTVMDAVLLLEVTVQNNIVMLDLIKKGLATLPDLSTKAVRTLRELKSNLTSYTTILEKLLLSRTNIGYQYCEIPMEKVRGFKNSVLDLIKKLSRDELHKVIDAKVTISPDHVLCSVLGLNTSCVEQLYSIPEETRSHEPDIYWIHRILEDNLANNSLEGGDAEGNIPSHFTAQMDEVQSWNVDIGLESVECARIKTDSVSSRHRQKSGDTNKKPVLCVSEAKDPDTADLMEDLQKMGFTPSRAQLICDGLPDAEHREYQKSLYWAQLYIDAAFEYDILLNSAPAHPYKPEKIGVIETQDVPTDERVPEDAQVDKMWPLRFVNLKGHKDDMYKQIYQSFSAASQPEDAENVYLFHATDHACAKDIIENGIHLSKGKREQDFSDGNGFYLSYTMDFAFDWAKSGRFRPSAILVFKVPKEVLKAFISLDLNDDQEKWTNVIQYYRSGQKIKMASRDLKKECARADMIDGPMCVSTPRDAKSPRFKPDGFARGVEHRCLCIKSQELADRVGDIRMIEFVIFFGMKK